MIVELGNLFFDGSVPTSIYINKSEVKEVKYNDVTVWKLGPPDPIDPDPTPVLPYDKTYPLM